MSTVDVSSGTLSVVPNGGDDRTSLFGSISFAAGAKLDLNDNDAIFQNQDLATTRSQILAGYNGGSWNGTGIVSTNARTSSSPKTGLGYGLQSVVNLPSRNLAFGYGSYLPASTDVIVRYTALGDADLSGKVDSTDFNRFVAGYGKPANALWTDGDFNYDGKVNTQDFNFLAGNFGVTVAGSVPGPVLGSVVPEPASLGSLVLLAGLFARRRKA
jgi:hypothetical protein